MTAHFTLNVAILTVAETFLSLTFIMHAFQHICVPALIRESRIILIVFGEAEEDVAGASNLSP